MIRLCQRRHATLLLQKQATASLLAACLLSVPVSFLTGGPLDISRAAAADNEASEAAPDPSAASARALRSLIGFLRKPIETRGSLAEQHFAGTPLNRADAEEARKRLGADALANLKTRHAGELRTGEIQWKEMAMPIAYRKFGKKPAEGWSLYISLHGGGGGPARMNDGQWENQKRLYQPAEGIYVAPRAPTNTWNLWHQSHIDPLFERLIALMVAIEDVNWNRVYVMGYSAGGDGVYQLAPRMSDRWAAAAMMAGHPNETSPLGLRNVPFILQMGGKDAAYDRNEIAAQWEKKLASLRTADPDGYDHLVKIYPEKGHWMDREDAMAIGWMAKRSRNPAPKRVIWVQDDVLHSQFYWLAVEGADQKKGTQVKATINDQVIDIDTKGIEQITLLLDDRLLDLNHPIEIRSKGKTLFKGDVRRTIKTLAGCFDRKTDPNLCFSGSVQVKIEQP